MRACIGIVASVPAAAAFAASAAASASEDPDPTAASSAASAGSHASTMVLSPSSALPSRTIPSSPARSAAANVASSTSAASPSALAVSRNAVPYSGPDAPPTFEISVRPTSLSTSPGVSPPSASTAAVIPRDRLAPWSPSPIAWSSLVSSSRAAETEDANSRTQASASDVSSGTQAPQRRPGVLTGASQSRVRSASSLVSVSMQPAISRLVT